MDHLAETHTRMIELEDDLLSQMDTCQHLIAVFLSHLRCSDEPLHPQIVREIVAALRVIETSIQQKLDDTQLDMIFLLQSRKKE